jgi:hypothetical protein
MYCSHYYTQEDLAKFGYTSKNTRIEKKFKILSSLGYQGATYSMVDNIQLKKKLIMGVCQSSK